MLAELLSVLLDELSVELLLLLSAELLSETVDELLSVFDDETVLLDELLVVEKDELSEAELFEKIPAPSELLQPAKIVVSISIAENAEKRLYFIKIPPEIAHNKPII